MLKGHKIFSKKWQEVVKDGEEWHKVEKLKIGDKKLKIVARKYGHLLKKWIFDQIWFGKIYNKVSENETS